MSLFELPVDDYKAPEIVPEGSYELQIYATDDTDASTGRPMVTCQLQILNPPADVANPSMVWHRVFGLMPQDPDNTRNAMLGNGKAFAQVFGLDQQTLQNPTAWAGLTGTCLVIVETDNNDVERNALKLPRPK